MGSSRFRARRSPRCCTGGWRSHREHLHQPRPIANSAVPSALASLTKGGLNAVTKALAVEYAGRGITRVDCPVANSYAPEIQRLAGRYSAQGVIFQLVYCDPDESGAEIRRHLEGFDYRIHAFRDPTRAFARHCQVKVTPEAAVFTADGTLAYSGRIDDRGPHFGQSRPKATQHDLARAIDAVIAGKSVPAPDGAAVGCFIEGE